MKAEVTKTENAVDAVDAISAHGVAIVDFVSGEIGSRLNIHDSDSHGA